MVRSHTVTMTHPSSPTVWRRWMAFEMKRLRQEAGLSQAEVAKVLDCQVPKISLTESAQRSVQEPDLQKLLELYKVPEERRLDYVEAARKARKKGWWERYGPHTVEQSLEFYVGLEQGAERLRTYQPAIFHGLLQTPEYAEAVLRRTTSAISQEKVGRLVEIRTHRQTALWRDLDPLRMWQVVDEAALRRVVGGRPVMRAQLTHLVEVVGKSSHITVQVIPFETGAYDGSYGPFTILSLPWPGDLGIVCLEQRWDHMYLDSLPDIDAHSQVFEHLCALALPPDESVDLIRSVAEGYA